MTWSLERGLEPSQTCYPCIHLLARRPHVSTLTRVLASAQAWSPQLRSSGPASPAGDRAACDHAARWMGQQHSEPGRSRYVDAAHGSNGRRPHVAKRQARVLVEVHMVDGAAISFQDGIRPNQSDDLSGRMQGLNRQLAQASAAARVSTGQDTSPTIAASRESCLAAPFRGPFVPAPSLQG